MLRIKKLDIFILKSFLLLFSGTFFICLFIFMMQFLWRYVDELVGKGLGIDIMAQFFFYSALTLIPMSLPLAILLASLITFGNFGERYELLSMKAAGIPLLRIIRPLVLFMAFLCCVSFFFQNIVGPKAQMKLWTLLISIKQKSPELDIPEGVFYSEIDGYNIFVKKKDPKTGIMKDMLIYNYADGFENARIIWASEGKMEMTADKKYLYLHLYNGEQFENLKSQDISSKNVPYRRESFREKHTLIKFDSNLNMADGEFLNSRSDVKNMVQISNAIDSLTNRADSIGRSMYKEQAQTTYRPIEINKQDSVKIQTTLAGNIMNVDSLFQTFSLTEKQKVLNNSASRMGSLASDWSMKSYLTKDLDSNIRTHNIDWHKKITLSLACLIFFFIGAPLGAIIRKGGLGMPVVISVIIFVIYYIIDSGATRVAKSNEMNTMLGAWMSTLVLAPIGTFLTYKSNNDSVVFNMDVYAQFFRMILGLRSSRHITKKEVIIDNPDYAQDQIELDILRQHCLDYMEKNKLSSPPNYYKIYTNHTPDNEVALISSKMESLIKDLSNSKDYKTIQLLNKLPYLSVRAHKSLSDKRWINLIIGICIPAGLFFYFRIWRFRRRLDKDLKVIAQTCTEINEQIKQL